MRRLLCRYGFVPRIFTQDQEPTRVCKGLSPGTWAAVVSHGGDGAVAWTPAETPRLSQSGPAHSHVQQHKLGSEEETGRTAPSKATGTAPATLQIHLSLFLPQQATWASILTRRHWFWGILSRSLSFPYILILHLKAKSSDTYLT